MRFLSLLLLGFLATTATAAERPNIVWISCEDISSHLGAYGDPNATTPHLDAFAEQAVRYTRAFTCHGVCAPSRTGIITGMYPITLGANHMRSKATLPDHVKCFPHYLREAGYYCTNNSKTDYNFHWKQNEVWDETSNKAHWKNRPQSDQPFFAVFNLTISHESRIWPKNWRNVVKDVPESELHDASQIKVPGLYPDVPEVREAHARLLDIIMVMDSQVGRYLREIDEAGLAEDTIVIFWSDHGNGFPRAKRWIYDSGTLVPMMARVPKKFRQAGQGEPGTTSDQLINLIDLGPTVLNLAGIKVPEQMFGRPFLGPNVPTAHSYIYGARDRVDERFDMVRSVRDQRYRYVRNLNPWRPALQHIQYAETSVVRQAMRSGLADGTLHEESAQFLRKPRAAEELYDLESDPWELTNLAKDPAHADVLKRFRSQCDEWQTAARDAHLIPESILDEEEKQVGSRWGILHGDDGRERAARLLSLAKTAAAPSADDEDDLLQAAKSDDAAARWWAMHGLANLQTAEGLSTEQIRTCLSDPSAGVRVAAARAAWHTSLQSAALKTLREALQHKSSFVKHAAINELDEIGSVPAEIIAEAQKIKDVNAYIGNVVRHLSQQSAAAN